MMSNNILLNIGCGSTHHEDWVNIDMTSSHRRVRAVNILKGLPFVNGSAAVCYSSHVLEHLSCEGARSLLLECMRVLKPGGIIRLAVPDLEGIVREYIRLLDQVTNKKMDDTSYDWIVLELLDQLVRVRSGGEMGPFLKGLKIENRDYVRSRLGREADHFWREPVSSERTKSEIFQKFLARICCWFNTARQALAGFLVLIVAGSQAKRSLRIGLFRTSGEVHQWMYDRYSLRRLLEQVGFKDFKVCSAIESRIPGFPSYALDAVGGVTRKPDSLFIEAVKPEAIKS
jgi:SAM-dependent methyltransferase